MRNSLQDQLKDFKVTPKTRKENSKTQFKKPASPPSNWIEDGVDHINILEQAATPIGRFLAHNAKYEFIHEKFGKFKSIECFWYYIQSQERDDRIRLMNGRTLKTFTECLTMHRVDNFRAIIADSNYQKLMQYNFAVQEMRDSTLPFDCYYINESGVRIRPTYFRWMLCGFEEIRKAIKEDRAPNFNFLLDVKKSSIYQFVLPSTASTEEEDTVKLLRYLEEE
jgi:hypothetical protein